MLHIDMYDWIFEVLGDQICEKLNGSSSTPFDKVKHKPGV